MNPTSQPARKLEVWRAFSRGGKALAGRLTQEREGVFFQYDQDYLGAYANLSPLRLQHTAEPQLAPRDPYIAPRELRTWLHGCFADSLPDGWGLLLQNRIFRQHDVSADRITQMDRLALVSDTGSGALGYRPVSSYAPEAAESLDLHALGLQAQALFDAQPDTQATAQLLGALAAVGSSGGARPKASVFFGGDDFTRCRIRAAPGDEAWLVKFTSQNLPLKHEEGICEAAYLTLAAKAGLAPPEWRLVPAPPESGAQQWLALKRFDRTANGKLHMLSACGLLDADFRSPSLDYEDLIKASALLCKSPAAGQMQFRRAVFNLLACNQDDHSKNWAFLQDDDGEWALAPFYDVTYSPNSAGEHMTAYTGYGKQPPVKAMQRLAAAAGFADWSQARQVIEATATAVAGFADAARALHAKPAVIREIEERLNAVWRDNRGLLG